MDLTSVNGTVIGTGIMIIGFVYAVYRNLKADIHAEINALFVRMDSMEIRHNSLDERMFLLITEKHFHKLSLRKK